VILRRLACLAFFPPKCNPLSACHNNRFFERHERGGRKPSEPQAEARKRAAELADGESLRGTRWKKRPRLSWGRAGANTRWVVGWLDRHSQRTHAGLQGPYTVGQNSSRLFLFRGVPSGRLGLLAAGERLCPEDQSRELSGDHPQLVLRAGFVEPVDHADQRTDMLLGLLEELLGGLGWHRTSSGRTATVGHDQALPAC